MHLIYIWRMSKIMTNRTQLLFTLQKLDEAAFCRVNNTQLSRQFFRSLSRSADGPYYVVVAALAWWLMKESSLHFLTLLGTAFLVERPLYFILKNGLKRNRPAQAIPGFVSAIVPSDHFSFPSGHTSAAFVFATTVVLSLPASAVDFKLLIIVCVYSWALLVAASRVMLGVHFPGDTMAGAILGAATTVSVHMLVLI